MQIGGAYSEFRQKVVAVGAERRRQLVPDPHELAGWRKGHDRLVLVDVAVAQAWGRLEDEPKTARSAYFSPLSQLYDAEKPRGRVIDQLASERLVALRCVQLVA